MKRTVEFMREQIEERRRLVQTLESQGEAVDPKFKKYAATNNAHATKLGLLSTQNIY